MKECLQIAKVLPHQFMFKEKKIHGKKLFLCWQLVNIWMIVPAAIVSVGDILLSVVRSDV